MVDEASTIGVRAELDISDLRGKFQRMTKYFHDADRRLEQHAERWNQSSSSIQRNAQQYLAHLDKLEQQERRLGSAQQEAADRMERLNRRRAEAEKGLTEVAQRQAESRVEYTEVETDEVESSVSRQLTAISRLRRDIFSLIFFMRFASRIVKAAWKAMGDAAETEGLVRGINTLADAYGQGLSRIAGAMDDASGRVVSRIELIQAAQQGLLADSGQFASRYGELWEAARVAAVTTGVEATDAFTGFVSALADGDAAMVDQISNLYNVEMATIRYAVASGRTVDQLSLQEKRQVILNEVMDTTNALLDSGAQAAIDAQAPHEELTRNIEAFGGAVGAILNAGLVELLASQIKTLTEVAIIGAASFAAIGEMVRAIFSGEGLTVDLADRMNQIFIDVFEATSTAAGMFGSIGKPGDGDGGGLVDALTPDPKELEDRLRAYHEFLQRLEELRVQYMSRLESLEMSHTDSLIELELDRQQKIEDIYIKAQRKREDLLLRYHRAVEDAHRRYARALEDIDRDIARKRRGIWERYWEDVYRIERQFQDSMYDAISKRSATAAINAMRKRERDLEDAERSRDKDLRNLSDNLQEQMEEARIKRDRMLEDAERAYQRGLDDLERNLQDQLDALERNLARQKERLERHYQWKLEKLRNQYRLEYLQALQAYTGQEELLAGHISRMQRLWNQFTRSLNLPPVPGAPTGAGSGYGGGGPTQGPNFAYGGAGVFDQPTNITVGDSPGGAPEMVVAMPLPQWAGGGMPAVQHMVNGSSTHRFDVRATGMGQGIDEQAIENVMVRVLREVWPDATVNRR